MTDQQPDNSDQTGADAQGEEIGADLGVRFVARLIDAIILWLVFVIIIVPIVVVAIFSGSGGLGFGGFGIGNLVAAVIGAAVTIGYFAYLESSRGQTVGKMVMKLKTVGPDGENPSMEMAAKRNAWYALGVIPVIGWLLQLGATIYIAVTINSSPTHTGWHDTFAGGTRVIKIG